MSYYVLIPGNKIDKPMLINYNDEDYPDNNYIQLDNLLHNLEHEHILKVYLKCSYKIYEELCKHACDEIYKFNNTQYRINIKELPYDIIIYHKYYDGNECDGMTKNCCDNIINNYLFLGT